MHFEHKLRELVDGSNMYEKKRNVTRWGESKLLKQLEERDQEICGKIRFGGVGYQESHLEYIKFEVSINCASEDVQ